MRGPVSHIITPLRNIVPMRHRVRANSAPHNAVADDGSSAQKFPHSLLALWDTPHVPYVSTSAHAAIALSEGPPARTQRSNPRLIRWPEILFSCRQPGPPLSAVRLFVLGYYQDQIFSLQKQTPTTFKIGIRHRSPSAIVRST